MATNEEIPIHKQQQPQHNQRSGTQDAPSDDQTPQTSVRSGVRLVAKTPAGDSSDSKRKKHLFLWIKGLFGLVFFVPILFCTVFSKLTLVSLTDTLRAVTYCNGSTLLVNETFSSISLACNHSQAVTLYWQLLLIIVIPNVISFVRSLAFGVLGKTTENFPWPTVSGIIVGGIASVLEVVAISVFVFLVLAELPPGISILLLSGVFFCQFAVDFVYTRESCCFRCRKKRARPARRVNAPVYQNGYQRVDSQDVSQDDVNHSVQASDPTQGDKEAKKDWRGIAEAFFRRLLENQFVKFVSLALQVTSLLAFIFVWCFYSMTEDKVHLKYLYRLRPMIALPICLLVLSFIWTNKFQDWIAQPRKYTENPKNRTARYKSSFINSSIRLFLYPFVTFVVFRFATSHQIDPWCLPGSCDKFGINFSGDTLWVFLVQVLTTLFAYIFAWIACTMTIGRFSMGAALFVSTPIAAASHYLHTFVVEESALFFPYFDYPSLFVTAYPVVTPLLFCVWFGQLLGMVFYISTKKNSILSKDSDMFLVPYYDGIFFEQHIILNRQTRKHPIGTVTNKKLNVKDPESQKTRPTSPASPRQRRTVFICSTMYRESQEEMRQMLTSIRSVAKHYDREKRSYPKTCDTFESHIFFDRTLNGTQLSKFGLQLLSLLEKALGVEAAQCTRIAAPYGMCLHYRTLGVNQDMPFYIHFKDPNKVKPGKRWSQVMYMNYVINHRIKNDPWLTADNTFILTTDADIDFTAKSAVVLLDMLESNPMVGAVCARTHPKGSGPLYWYQVFDYALGHWFQKPAEHLLGCVLCCPGCFSVFRCSALEDVIETYSSKAANGVEFLMKNMGEDRWLSTLLIKERWRLEYCAISKDYTYCPQSFNEFFVQRRRWIPSTVANLAWLISRIFEIPRNNDSVSVLFILFQTIIFVSTAISPATVILVIASGLQSAFGLSDPVVLLIILVLIIVSVVYGAVCLFASPKTQIDVAKVLSFVFAIVMIIVLAGITQLLVRSIIPKPGLEFLKGLNCTVFDGQAKEDCIKSAHYLDSLPNSLIGEQFMLPVSTIVIYFGVFAVTFLLAAILHLREFPIVFLVFIYILALPCGYLLLLIYSAANLDSQSWGTRESGIGRDEGLLGWGKCIKKTWKNLVSCCVQSMCCKRDGMRAMKVDSKAEDEQPLVSAVGSRQTTPESEDEIEDELSEEVQVWLRTHDCGEEYYDQFARYGYTTMYYIAEMKLEDFEAIGIRKFGIRHRLAKAARKVPALSINVNVPDNVGIWLQKLEMNEYTGLFKTEGFSEEEDVEHLKLLTRRELTAMGITKRAHLNRLLNALHFLTYPDDVEERMSTIKQQIEAKPESTFRREDNEKWKKLVKETLEPVPEQLTSVEELRKSLRSLRNHSLVALFLINVMWIIVLFTIRIPRLSDYGFNPRAFQLLFLVVYGFILLVQFVALVCHRGITLVHFFGRITPKEAKGPDSKDDFLSVEMETSLSNTA